MNDIFGWSDPPAVPISRGSAPPGYHDFPEYNLISHSWEVDPSFSRGEAERPHLHKCSYAYPSVEWLKRSLLKHGFKQSDIRNFMLENLSISKSHLPGVTYTQLLGDNTTASMLGVVQQPWKHVFASK